MYSTDWLMILFILLTIGENIHASFSTGCNPVYCFSVLDSLFDNDGKDSCLKASKLVNCASPCFPSASENVIIKGLKVMEDGLCSDLYQEDSYNVNKCLSQQKYALFSCFYKFFNSEADDPQVDPKFLNCKISLDVGICERLNTPCTSRASYISGTLLQDFYRSFLSDCSGIDGEDIKNIRLKTSNFKEYGLLAECLDKNSNLVTQCFSKAVVDLSLTSSKDMCRMNAATHCIEDIVLNNCDSRIHLFRNISHSLANRLLPFCSKSNITESQEYQKARIYQTTLKTMEFSDLPKTEKATESTELSSLQTPVSSKTPATKDLSTGQNDFKFHTTDEINSDFSKKVIQNITALSTNNTVLSSNSTPPIVIHKHIVMTVSYRPKSDANSSSVFFALVGILCAIQYLSTGMLMQ